MWGSLRDGSAGRVSWNLFYKFKAHKKSQLWWHELGNPALGSQSDTYPWAHWHGSLAYLASSRLVADTVFKKDRWQLKKENRG